MKWIKFSKINGSLSAPASKSMMLRATAAALLSKGQSLIENPSFCNDALTGLRIAEELGARLRREDRCVKITGGRFLQKNLLNCQESGLCMRMFTPIAALDNRNIIVTGRGSLLSRPVSMMEEPLNTLGASCISTNGFLPLKVKGPIKGGEVKIDGSLSSQFLTGLLMALPLCEEDSEIGVENLKSKPYVAMTLALLNLFGISISYEENFEHFSIQGKQYYQNTTYTVEGDWSGASFLLVAGAICGQVEVLNLQKDSLQADKRILEALILAEAEISIKNNTVSVKKSDLKAFEFDATECPDLFPPLTALACYCSGKSLISGVERLRYKESDRAQALLSEFSKLGAKIRIIENRMEIEGPQLKGGNINSHNDHRIAMAGAVAGLNTENGVHIKGWECVSKSYPHFFEDLISIGGKME